MSTTKTYIANIDTKRRDWTLTVRITRMWEVKYNPTSEIVDSLGMVLFDEQGSQIHALIKKDLTPHFKEVAKQGSVYTILHFGVGNNKRSHQQIQNDNIIWVNSFTSLKFKPKGLVDIPKHNFTFQPFEQLDERTNRKDILTGVENKINKTATTEGRRTIHITNESIHGIKLLTLQNPGNYQLNSTSGTKVQINLDILEVHTFRERWPPKQNRNDSSVTT
ncbi:Replication protein A 70 kDa DNA-binding subunit A [Bienertia sinuspersici]